MLALDLDLSRGPAAGDPAAQVSDQADAITRLVTRLGGRCLADVAPSGGRHILILFSAPLPWRELRDVARALALRFGLPVRNHQPQTSMIVLVRPESHR